MRGLGFELPALRLVYLLAFGGAAAALSPVLPLPSGARPRHAAARLHALLRGGRARPPERRLLSLRLERRSASTLRPPLLLSGAPPRRGRSFSSWALGAVPFFPLRREGGRPRGDGRPRLRRCTFCRSASSLRGVPSAGYRFLLALRLDADAFRSRSASTRMRLLSFGLDARAVRPSALPRRADAPLRVRVRPPLPLPRADARLGLNPLAMGLGFPRAASRHPRVAPLRLRLTPKAPPRSRAPPHAAPRALSRIPLVAARRRRSRWEWVSTRGSATGAGGAARVGEGRHSKWRRPGRCRCRRRIVDGRLRLRIRRRGITRGRRASVTDRVLHATAPRPASSAPRRAE